MFLSKKAISWKTLPLAVVVVAAGECGESTKAAISRLVRRTKNDE